MYLNIFSFSLGPLFRHLTVQSILLSKTIISRVVCTWPGLVIISVKYHRQETTWLNGLTARMKWRWCRRRAIFKKGRLIHCFMLCATSFSSIAISLKFFCEELFWVVSYTYVFVMVALLDLSKAIANKFSGLTFKISCRFLETEFPNYEFLLLYNRKYMFASFIC